MANTLKGWLVDNTVTTDPNDKILVLETTGKADLEKVYQEMPSELTLLVPADLAAGNYELTVCTQFCSGGIALKEPRRVSVNVTVAGSGGDGGDENPDIL